GATGLRRPAGAAGAVGDHEHWRGGRRQGGPPGAGRGPLGPGRRDRQPGQGRRAGGGRGRPPRQRRQGDRLETQGGVTMGKTKKAKGSATAPAAARVTTGGAQASV